MTDRDAMIAPACEEMAVTYLLPGGATPLVHPGDSVVAGDALARGSRPPALVAYAAALGLSVGEAATAIERYDGAEYRAGTQLGTRRVGLRTRSVSARASGLLNALPNSGALAIRDESGTCEYRARQSGVVRESNEREIVVASAIARWPCAFVNGTPMFGALHIAADVLAATLTRDTALPLEATGDYAVVAHVADTAVLAALRPRRHGTLLVGSVSEDVAWQLMVHSQAARHGTARQMALIVLHGVGDADIGIATTAMFGGLDGALMRFEWLSRTVVAILPFGRGSSKRADRPSRQSPDLRAISAP